jgi:hypothetical protein
MVEILVSYVFDSISNEMVNISLHGIVYYCACTLTVNVPVGVKNARYVKDGNKVTSESQCFP